MSGVFGVGCGQGSQAGHSLALHLLLLLKDLVGLHCQPLLHEELLPLQLTLPCFLQPFAVCHEQLPALSGGEEFSPGEYGHPCHRVGQGSWGPSPHSELTAPATIEMVRLRLLFRTFTACGDRETVSCGLTSDWSNAGREQKGLSHRRAGWKNCMGRRCSRQGPHLTSLWSRLEKSMPLTSTIWSPVWGRNRKGLVCVCVCVIPTFICRKVSWHARHTGWWSAVKF